jgi:hypothetical protein
MPTLHDMLDLRPSINSQCEELFWYVHLGDLPFYQYIEKLSEELPCDLSELTRSMEKDGLYCLFRCTCGDPGCNSTWVEVAHKENEIRWLRAYSHDELGARGATIGDVGWSFPKGDYFTTITAANRIHGVISKELPKVEFELGNNET